MYGVGLRFTGALLILYTIMLFRKQRLPFDRTSWSIFIVLGCFSYSIPFILVYWAERTIGSGLACILFAIYPFVVALISHRYLEAEKLNYYKAIGISAGFLGILVIFWDDIHLGSANTTAMAAVLLSAVMQGASLVMVKKNAQHIPPIALNCGGMIFGVLMTYILAFAFEDFTSIKFDSTAVWSILYLAVFGTSVAFVIYYWLLRRVEAVYLSLVTLITPVFAVLLGAIVFHERLSPRIASGGVLVLVGIGIANGNDFVKLVKRKRSPDLESVLPVKETISSG
jgi:drug/metabolite transporter (DMT)-like permease